LSNFSSWRRKSVWRTTPLSLSTPFDTLFSESDPTGLAESERHLVSSSVPPSGVAAAAGEREISFEYAQGGPKRYLFPVL
jgi:hypothetical protein